jgi:hypothetical protein
MVYLIPFDSTRSLTSIVLVVIWFVCGGIEVVWQLAATVVVPPLVVPVPEQFVLLVPGVVYVDVCSLTRLAWVTARTVKDCLFLSLAKHTRTTATDRGMRGVILRMDAPSKLEVLKILTITLKCG